MTRFPLESSHLKSVGYENGTMEVEFRNGHRYRYKDVGPNVYSGLVKATSPGSFFHRFVRDRFEGEKIEDDRESVPPAGS